MKVGIDLKITDVAIKENIVKVIIDDGKTNPKGI